MIMNQQKQNGPAAGPIRFFLLFDVSELFQEFGWTAQLAELVHHLRDVLHGGVVKIDKVIGHIKTIFLHRLILPRKLLNTINNNICLSFIYNIPRLTI